MCCGKNRRTEEVRDIFKENEVTEFYEIVAEGLINLAEEEQSIADFAETLLGECDENYELVWGWELAEDIIEWTYAELMEALDMQMEQLACE